MWGGDQIGLLNPLFLDLLVQAKRRKGKERKKEEKESSVFFFFWFEVGLDLVLVWVGIFWL